jgi:L-fuculose-phosphate aldolase
LSFAVEEILPQDEEGKFYFHSIPVVVAKDSIGSEEVARLAVPFLKDGKIVVVRGHGVFSASDNLEHAYQWVSSLEHSAKILVYKKILRGGEVSNE